MRRFLIQRFLEDTALWSGTKGTSAKERMRGEWPSGIQYFVR